MKNGKNQIKRLKAACALLLALVLLCACTTALADDADKYDLDNFAYRSVQTKGRGDLVFQRSPRGSFMKNHVFEDGDDIRVNLYWREDGYAIAYEGGDYGYVDASYINWDGKKSSGGSASADKYDLDLFEYRQVRTKGKGALIFQKAPRGAFMKSFKYDDGEWIYVNLNWRQGGYAIAYENGTFGYVDASYIDW